jgi:hypothetical protein
MLRSQRNNSFYNAFWRLPRNGVQMHKSEGKLVVFVGNV